MKAWARTLCLLVYLLALLIFRKRSVMPVKIEVEEDTFIPQKHIPKYLDDPFWTQEGIVMAVCAHVLDAGRIQKRGIPAFVAISKSGIPLAVMAILLELESYSDSKKPGGIVVPFAERCCKGADLLPLPATILLGVFERIVKHEPNSVEFESIAGSFRASLKQAMQGKDVTNLHKLFFMRDDCMRKRRFDKSLRAMLGFFVLSERMKAQNYTAEDVLLLLAEVKALFGATDYMSQLMRQELFKALKGLSAGKT